MSFDKSCVVNLSGKDDQIISYSVQANDCTSCLILLTSKGDVYVSYLDSVGKTQQHLPGEQLFGSEEVPLQVCLLPGLAGVAFALTNQKLVIYPIDYFIKTRNHTISDPYIINLRCGEKQTSSEIRNLAAFKSTCSPTTMYIIFNTTDDSIHIIDVIQKSTAAIVRSSVEIKKMNVVSIQKTTYLIVQSKINSQQIAPIETEHCCLRETLEHLEFTELTDLGYNFGSHALNRIVHWQMGNSDVKVSALLDAEWKESFSIPSDVLFFCYTNAAIICFSNQGNVQILPRCFLTNSESGNSDSSRLIDAGKVNEFSKENPLMTILCIKDSLNSMKFYVILNRQVFLYKTDMAPEMLIFQCLRQSYFSTDMLSDIAKNLGKEVKEIVIMYLSFALQQGNKTGEIDGMVSAAFYYKVPIPELIVLLSKKHSLEYLVPYLQAECERDLNCIEHLYNVHLRLLHSENHHINKAIVERDLRKCLYYCSASTNTFHLFLRNSLWSCVRMLLIKDCKTYSESFISYVIENTSPTQPEYRDIASCFTATDFMSARQRVENLLRQMDSYVVTACPLSQIMKISQIGHYLSQFFPVQGNVTYLNAAIRYLSHFEPDSVNLILPPQKQNVIHTGANCSIAISEDDEVMFWGEFSASEVQLRTEVKRLMENSKKPELTLFPKAIQIEGAEKIQPVKVVCGTEHLLVLTNDHKVYAQGINRYGQCGIEGLDVVKKLTHVQQITEPVIDITAGHYHSGAVTADSQVYVWGWNLHGQLGVAFRGRRLLKTSTPTLLGQIPESTVIASLAFGYAHSLFLSTDGRVFGCGSSTNGQLALESSESKNKTVKGVDAFKCFDLVHIPFDEPIDMLSSQYFHAVAVGCSGKVFEWGMSPGELRVQCGGAKKRTQKEILTQIAEARSSVDLTAIKVVKQFVSERVISVSAGYSHNVVLTDCGVYAWGSNLKKQLGHNQDCFAKITVPFEEGWQSVVCGRETTLGIGPDNRIYAWGRNDKSQLGVRKTSGKDKVLRIQMQKTLRDVIASSSSVVDTPTVVPGLLAANIFRNSGFLTQQYIEHRIASLNRIACHKLSLILVKNMISNWFSLRVFLANGDLIAAVEVLRVITNKTRVQETTASEKSSQNNSDAVAISGFAKEHKQAAEQIISLLQVHPIVPVKIFVIAFMIQNDFLSDYVVEDAQLCRYIEPYLTKQNALTSSTGSNSNNLRRLCDMPVRQRSSVIKKSKLTKSIQKLRDLAVEAISRAKMHYCWGSYSYETLANFTTSEQASPVCEGCQKKTCQPL